MGGSIRDLADKVGRDEKAIRLWMKREDWPFPNKGPWKVKEIRIWMETYLESDPSAEYRKGATEAHDGAGEYANAAPLARAQIDSITERTRLIRQRRLAEESKLISVEEAQRIRTRQIKAVRDAFRPLPRSISNILVGKSSDQIEEALAKRMKMIIQAFSRGEVLDVSGNSTK